MAECAKLTGDWDKFDKMLANNPIKKAISKARAQIGIKGASLVKKGIQSGAPGGKTFEALSSFTTERKGSSKPLIDNGDLIGAVSYAPVGSSDVFIGVKRGVKRKGEDDVVDLAAVHEYGCTIGVTPKMKVYLHYQGVHLSPSTKYIVIPERSFLRTTFTSDEFQEMVADTGIDCIKEVLNP